MKCELCKKAEATTAVTITKDGVARELYVCSDCAAAAKKGDEPKSQKQTPPSRKLTIVGGDGESAPPFVTEFVKATLGFMKEVAEAEQNERRVCPVCKAKWDKIKEDGLLGCPTCWRTFARQIRDEFLVGEFGRAHLGKAPAVERLERADDARAVLERELKDAVAREDYHRAALLKKKLDALQRGAPE
ncbi:MAG: hypothetical protein ACI4RA_03270 [Kiritimatiellia bacterium]